MPRRNRFTRSCTALFATVALLAGLLAGVASAHAAAPVVTNAKFSGPVAYELKSLLTTRFSCDVDQAGTTGKLDILGASGVVKTIYNGALVQGTNWLPLWNGLDSSGNKLPSASYDWRLTVSKNGESTVVRGKITVSKINFYVKGSLANGASTSASRYMIPGTANCYIWAKTDTGTTATAVFGIDLSYVRNLPPYPPMTIPYPGAFLSIASGSTATHYLRDPWVITTRANRTLSIRNASQSLSGSPSMDFYMTVIQ